MANEPFVPVMRLNFQGSIPIGGRQDGKAEYESLKIFLKAINPNVALNGQIMEMLEPCCNERKEKTS